MLLQKLAAAAGRDPLPVTAFLWEPDKTALAACAEAGVARAVVYTYPSSREQTGEFLARLRALA
jgi:hypothetical protein